jgi:HAD superfamily hydrolase (TIGR01484 family)
MGRPFQTELDHLAQTYSWSASAKLQNLPSFVSASLDRPLIALGSGGSLTAAMFACLLHQEAGLTSQCTTPLELVNSRLSLREYSVLLISARGRNYDAIQSLRTVLYREPSELLVLCASRNSPLAKLARNYSYARVDEYGMEFGRDGFLAVNSLLAFVVFLSRSYDFALSKPVPLPSTLDEMMRHTKTRREIHDEFTNSRTLTNRKTFIILYGKWGKPAAIDLESKFSEAALDNVMLADFRNFAHGRHNWLAKRPNDSIVLTLETPADTDLSRRTLRLLPRSVPIFRLSSSYDNPRGSINLIVQGMYAVEALGRLRGIDPGKPGVPEFGQRIYNLRLRSNTGNKSSLRDLRLAAIERKMRLSDQFFVRYSQAFWLEAAQLFVHRLELANFAAVVFDYDGTLCDPARRFGDLSDSITGQLARLIDHGIAVGIATGRGKSVGDALRKKIRKDQWDEITIGYYNGSVIGPLSDKSLPSKAEPLNPVLAKFVSMLKKYYYTAKLKIEPRPMQVTFEPIEPTTQNQIFPTLNELAQTDSFKDLRVVRSSHSIDVLAPGVSKLNLVRHLQAMVKNRLGGSSILCIGDSGSWPGNDYDMLSGDYSLSVNSVSSSPVSCWNLSPRGIRGEEATLAYLRALSFNHKLLNFRLRRMVF